MRKRVGVRGHDRLLVRGSWCSWEMCTRRWCRSTDRCNSCCFTATARRSSTKRCRPCMWPQPTVLLLRVSITPQLAVSTTPQLVMSTTPQLVVSTSPLLSWLCPPLPCWLCPPLHLCFPPSPLSYGWVRYTKLSEQLSVLQQQAESSRQAEAVAVAALPPLQDELRQAKSEKAALNRRLSVALLADEHHQEEHRALQSR